MATPTRVSRAEDNKHKGTPLLHAALTAALPRGSRAKVYHLRSRTRRCEPLFSPLPGSKGEDTRQSSHFLAISINVPTSESPRDVLIFAVEVLIYSTKSLTTLFVSKADSTGYRDKSSNPVPIRHISTTFLRWLIDKELTNEPTRPVVVSLFGRAQGAYLFPGSAENSKKHVLDDRQLVKWWVKALDPLLNSASIDSSSTPRHGYVTVPGYQGVELRQFLPPGQAHWTAGNPLQQLARIRGLPEHAPTRCLLPRFPDDPKARYMLDLDDEVGLHEDAGASAVLSPSKRKDGRWKTIRSMERFWEGMEFRQECSSGRVVGFLWLVINARRPIDYQARESSPSMQAAQVIKSHHQAKDIRVRKVKKTKRKEQKRLTGAIIFRAPRIKGSSTEGETSHDHDESGLTLTTDGYDQIMQTMLHLDFATSDSAARSTRKWLAEIASVAARTIAEWTLEIEGVADLSAAHTTSATAAGRVNDLGSMLRKKKRGIDDAVSSIQDASAESSTTPVVNTLGAGLIRKKAKVS